MSVPFEHVCASSHLALCKIFMCPHDFLIGNAWDSRFLMRMDRLSFGVHISVQPSWGSYETFMHPCEFLIRGAWNRRFGMRIVQLSCGVQLSVLLSWGSYETFMQSLDFTWSSHKLWTYARDLNSAWVLVHVRYYCFRMGHFRTDRDTYRARSTQLEKSNVTPRL